MCGRFNNRHSAAEISECFEVDDVLFEPHPRFNIAPTQFIPVIIQQAT